MYMIIILRDVCIRVEAKDLRGVHQRKVFNSLLELVQPLTLGNTITFIESKTLSKHVVTKPNLYSRETQT